MMGGGGPLATLVPNAMHKDIKAALIVINLLLKVSFWPGKIQISKNLKVIKYLRTQQSIKFNTLS